MLVAIVSACFKPRGPCRWVRSLEGEGVHGVELGPSGASTYSLQLPPLPLFPSIFPTTSGQEEILEKVRGHSLWTEVLGSESDPSPPWPKGFTGLTIETSAQRLMDLWHWLHPALPHLRIQTLSKECAPNSFLIICVSDDVWNTNKNGIRHSQAKYLKERFIKVVTVCKSTFP